MKMTMRIDLDQLLKDSDDTRTAEVRIQSADGYPLVAFHECSAIRSNMQVGQTISFDGTLTHVPRALTGLGHAVLKALAHPDAEIMLRGDGHRAIILRDDNPDIAELAKAVGDAVRKAGSHFHVRVTHQLI
jgi:hypothetical protein